MPLATEVTLPREQKPIFPDLCVVCCYPHPQGKASLWASNANPLLGFLLPILFLFGWKRVTVPVCRPGCKRRFLFQRWGRNVLTLILVLIALFLLGPLTEGLTGGIRRITMAALVIVALIPYFVFETLWPRSVDLTAYKDSIDYEFASEFYALEFQRLNPGAVIKHE